MDKQNTYRANCNGNSFAIIFKDQLNISLNASSIQYICDYNNYRKDDGLLVIDRFDSEHDFVIEYYNNDGTWETFCANGTLCAIRLLLGLNHQFNNLTLKAGDGIHKIKFDRSDIFLEMKKPVFKSEEVDICTYIGRYVDSGAKHFVTKYENNNINELYTIAQKIRYHENFQPSGINVNFLKIINSNEISVITYEKGIEKIMLSCGSGSVAAAFYAFNIDTIISPLKIFNQGGEMQLIFNQSWDSPWFSSNPVIEKKLEIKLI